MEEQEEEEEESQPVLKARVEAPKELTVAGHFVGRCCKGSTGQGQHSLLGVDIDFNMGTLLDLEESKNHWANVGLDLSLLCRQLGQELKAARNKSEATYLHGGLGGFQQCRALRLHGVRTQPAVGLRAEELG